MGYVIFLLWGNTRRWRLRIYGLFRYGLGIHVWRARTNDCKYLGWSAFGDCRQHTCDVRRAHNESRDVTYAVAFGDFGAGYTIAERPDLRVLRDPFSAKPNVLFYATKRVGGDVTDFHAIKLLKFATA